MSLRGTMIVYLIQDLDTGLYSAIKDVYHDTWTDFQPRIFQNHTQIERHMSRFKEFYGKRNLAVMNFDLVFRGGRTYYWNKLHSKNTN